MRCRIVEDCSPYFITFTHDGMNEVFDTADELIKHNEYAFTISGYDKFSHNRLTLEQSVLIEKTPAKMIENFKYPIAAIFTSEPSLYYPAHKDGMHIRFAINYIIKASDENCVTSWYDDVLEKRYVTTCDSSSREVMGFNPSEHTPLKSTIFKQGQCVLFNTDIYHDFSNVYSNNIRHVLTIRSKNSPQLYFDDARKQLFK